MLVREVAAYRAKGNYGFLRGLLLRFRMVSLIASVIVALVAAGVGYWFYRESAMIAPFLLAIILVPLYAATKLQGAALRGLRYLILGQISQALRPALVIVVIGFMYWTFGNQLTAESALYAQLAASTVLVAVTFYLLREVLPKEAKTAEPDFETSRWMKSAVPFVFAGAMQTLNKETSTVLLGLFQDPENVGLFRVAQRGAMLIPFGLGTINIVIAPTVSELFVKGEEKRLQRMISKSIIGVLIFSLPVGLFLILFGERLISIVFGEAYEPAYIPMVILCIGQLFSTAVGSVGMILNMVGLERFTARGVAIAALANVILSFVLIPILGVSGAAIASATSLVIWNALLFIWLYRRTGIVSTVRWRSL